MNEQLTLDIGGGAAVGGGVAGYVGSAVETAAVQSQVTSSPTVVSVDDPLAGHPLEACGADEAKQKENQK